MIYKLAKNIITGEVNSASYSTEDGKVVSFNFDSDNTDYQAYLKWVDEGNTPLPADS